MIINKTIKIKWSIKNKEWYISRGYKFTKVNDDFQVKIDDLSNGSNIRIDVQCDCCKMIKSLRYCDYIKSLHSSNEYFCFKCAIHTYGNEKRIKSRLKNSKSFEQWCMENNRQDILDRWDYKLNDLSPSEISYSSAKKCWFKCSNISHKSELKNISSFKNRKEGNFCIQCNSFAQYLINTFGENALNIYWDYEKNEKICLDPWMISYASHTKVWIKCQEKDYHDSYNISCLNFYNNYRCPFCSNKNGKTHAYDSLAGINSRIIEIWSDKNKKSPYEYAPSSGLKVWWKCSEGLHEDYFRSIHDSNDAEFRCPKCTSERRESLLQEKVRLYLQSLDYTVLNEHSCSIRPINPKTKMPLPYDNEVFDLKLIIEVHGEQHYSQSSYSWFSGEYNKRRLYDRYKRIYCKSKNYNYLEIPYWTDDKKETWKKLINYKIKDITS